MLKNKKICFLIFICLYFLFVIPVQLKPSNYPADDSYFYLQIAYNLASGHGSSFNSITMTNGYHPLWMIFCVIGILLSSFDKNIAIHLIIAFQQLLFIGIIFYFSKLSRLLYLKFFYSAIPILAAFFLTGLFGSEAHINGLTLMAGCYYFFKSLNQKIWSSLIIAGILFGLALLSRLDNIFIIGVFIIQLFFLYKRHPNILNLILKLTAPIIIIILPYLISNIIFFGHIMPISGKLHSSFPEIEFHLKSLGNLGTIVTIAAIISVLISYSDYYSENKIQKLLFRIFGYGILLHSLWLVLFSNDDIPKYSWYFVPGIFNICFLISTLLETIFEKFFSNESYNLKRKIILAFVSVCILAGLSRDWSRYYNPDAVNSISVFYSLNKSGDERSFIELAKWMKKNLPENSKIFTEDAAGMIAWYSDLKILAVDGLTCDYKYNDDIIAEGINQYLKNKDVNYFLGSFPENNGELDVSSPLYKKSCGKIKIEKLKSVKEILPERIDLGKMVSWSLCKINF